MVGAWGGGLRGICKPRPKGNSYDLSRSFTSLAAPRLGRAEQPSPVKGAPPWGIVHSVTSREKVGRGRSRAHVGRVTPRQSALACYQTPNNRRLDSAAAPKAHRQHHHPPTPHTHTRKHRADLSRQTFARTSFATIASGGGKLAPGEGAPRSGTAAAVPPCHPASEAVMWQPRDVGVHGYMARGDVVMAKRRNGPHAWPASSHRVRPASKRGWSRQWGRRGDSQFSLAFRKFQASERPGGNRRNPVASEVSKRACTAWPNRRQLVVSTLTLNAQLGVPTARAVCKTARQHCPSRIGLGTFGCARRRQAEAIVTVRLPPGRGGQTGHMRSI